MTETGKTMKRRNFLGRALAGSASLGLVSVKGAERLFAAPQASPGPKKGTMIRRALGKTGIELPVVNMGVMNAFNPELVKRSFEEGVRHFDTAAYYQRGQNEVMIGKALEEMGVRDQVVIGTKVYIPHDQRPRLSDEELKQFFLKTADESLSRLRTNVLDVLYIHNVLDTGYLNNPGIREALLTLKQQKKVRHLGFSVHMKMAELIRDAVQRGFYEVIAVAFNYSMADDAGLIQALRDAHEKGIGLVAMKTQCTQYWYRDYVPPEKQAYYQGQVLHTAVLKWVLQHPFITCAIPGYTTFEQMETALSVAKDLSFTPEEKKFLEDKNVKLALQSYCVQCAKCLPTCPHGADIPSLMRAHLYAACYGNLFEARDAVASTSLAKGLGTCVECGTCRVRCSRRVPVEKRIEELKAVFA